ncbi:MAG TPA: prephenate dehydratase [Polyangiaceae bacterium]|nr:prephenate dehydratase [Polyangiaceae bacterium]
MSTSNSKSSNSPKLSSPRPQGTEPADESAAADAPSLESMRSEIDRVDDQLLELLERRADVARRLAALKRSSGLSLRDADREARLLARLEGLADAHGGLFPKSSIRPIFREIISACLSLQEPQTVAYLGPPGTFSHIAARAAFGLGAKYVELPSIGQVVDAVARGAVSYGLAPIENSTEGAVGATLAALLECDVMIERELVIPVSACLLAQSTDLSSIRRVYSHPQPLAQCRNWLAQNLPHAELVSSASTAAAAGEARVDETAAAVGSHLSAELYDLKVVRENIQDRPENATRFCVLSKQDAPRSGRDKTSLVFSTPHARGALRRALTIFDDEGLNLTRIESRPALGQRWQYVFFTDVEGHRSDAEVSRAIERLRTDCSTVKVLGSYPRCDAPENLGTS